MINNRLMSKKWLFAGCAILSVLILFFMISATRSSEMEIQQKTAAQASLQTLENQQNTGSEVNYTEILSQNIFNEILSQLDLTQVSDLESTASEQALLEAMEALNLQNIEKQISKTDLELMFSTNINPDEILITTDNSRDSAINYLTKLSEIIGSTKQPLLLAMAKINTQTSNPSPTIDFYASAEQAYKSAYDKAKKLIVPSLFKEQHQKELELMLAQVNVFNAISQMQTDPYKSVLAAEYMDQIAQKGSDLEKEINTIFSGIK